MNKVIMVQRSKYVLVTPVRNEESTIGATLESVVRQIHPPSQWIVVNDGSTDGTDAIVERYASAHHYIHHLKLMDRPARSFSSVVFAVEHGIAALTQQHDYLGLLDADVRFGPDYFAELISKFEGDSSLGLAGGHVVDYINGIRRPIHQSMTEVAGAVQFFRRECFEQIGGLVAIPEGGWDAITCLSARLHGFTTRTFADLPVDHLKPRSVSEGNVFRRALRLGERDYALGYLPAFELARCLYRVPERPPVVGSLLRLAGFARATLVRRSRVLSDKFVAHVREEQLVRLFPWRRRGRRPAEAPSNI